MAKHHRLKNNMKKSGSKSSHHFSRDGLIAWGMRTAHNTGSGKSVTQLKQYQDISEFCSDSALEWAKNP